MSNLCSRRALGAVFADLSPECDCLVRIRVISMNGLRQGESAIAKQWL